MADDRDKDRDDGEPINFFDDIDDDDIDFDGLGLGASSDDGDDDDDLFNLSSQRDNDDAHETGTMDTIFGGSPGEDDDDYPVNRSDDDDDSGSHPASAINDYSAKRTILGLGVMNAIGIAAVLVVVAGGAWFIFSGDDEEPAEQTADQQQTVEEERSKDPDDYPKYRPIPPEDAPVDQVSVDERSADDVADLDNNEEVN